MAFITQKLKPYLWIDLFRLDSKGDKMNGKQFVEFHLKTVTRMNDVCKAKSQDYSGGGDSYAFNNFTIVEHLGNCSAEQGFIARMTDKLSRITNLVKVGGVGAVKDESIQDTLMDLANYSILMMGYLESKKQKGDL